MSPRQSIWLLVLAAALVAARLPADESKEDRVAFECHAQLMPGTRVAVSPNVAGQVVEVMIEEGVQVKKGDLLARLGAEEQKVNLQLAEGKLKLANAELNKAR